MKVNQTVTVREYKELDYLFSSNKQFTKRLMYFTVVCVTMLSRAIYFLRLISATNLHWLTQIVLN